MPTDRYRLVTIILIAAVAKENRVIGAEGDMPWHLPEDLKRFKRLTTGHPLLMGRRTFESITNTFGAPLPDRQQLILTTTRTYDYPDVETYASIPKALDAVPSDATLYVGGGQQIYEQFLPRADRLELTEVNGHYEGDTFFPPYKHLIGDTFVETRREAHDEFDFVTYDRVQARSR
ncbi:MAG: dihydrofolate reductase [Longimonas sp.]|uniref:dihydrofolate reductase n=1 Tax=Longimonas sp. TaxID=2039626 RepID=UPI003976B98F